MPAAIFNNTAVKILKDILRFKSGAQVLSISVDPSVSAVDASLGDFAISTNGNVYVKQDSGSTTNWLKSSSITDLYKLYDNRLLGGGTLTYSAPTPYTLETLPADSTTSGGAGGTTEGQSFTIGGTSVSITDVGLQIFGAAASGTFRYLIYATTANAPSGPILAATAAQSYTTLPAADPGSPYMIPLTSPVTLSAGTTYILMLENLTNIAVNIRYNSSSTISGGQFYHSGTVPSLDAPFRITGTSGGGGLSFTSSLFLEKPGLAATVNTIPTSQSPINLVADKDAAYVTPNTVGPGGNLTVTVTTLASVPSTAVIIAIKDGSSIIVGGTTKLLTGESTILHRDPPDTTKQDVITGAATTITSSNLTASRALISDGSGKVAVSSATSAELAFVSGVTSSVQTQIDNKANKTLNNLTSPTAIPVDLLPASDLLINIGAAGNRINNIFTDKLKANDSTASIDPGARTLIRASGATMIDWSGAGSAISMGSNRLSNVVNPTGAQDAATKDYVDSALQGLKPKQAARVATTAALSLATDLENGDVVDTVTLVTGDRVLVKNQSSPSENGIYIVSASGAASRATDFDSLTPIDEINGAYTFVRQGSQSGTSFVVSAVVSILGTDPITFVHFNDATTLVGGDMITVTGVTASVDLATVSGLESSNPGNNAGQLRVKLESSNPSLQIDGSNQLGSKLDAAGTITSGASGLTVGTDNTTIEKSSNALRIKDAGVSNAKLANMATQTFKGRTTAGTGAPEDLTATQATAMLNLFAQDLKGLASGPTAAEIAANKFLRADNTWQTSTSVANLSVTTKTANYTATSSDNSILGNAAGGGFTITLPSASGNTGKVFYFTRINLSGGDITITRAGSDTIIGEISQTLITQYTTLILMSDGVSTWYVL